MNEKKLENAVLALCELYDEAHKAQNWESMERIEEAIDALFVLLVAVPWSLRDSTRKGKRGARACRNALYNVC